MVMGSTLTLTCQRPSPPPSPPPQEGRRGEDDQRRPVVTYDKSAEPDGTDAPTGVGTLSHPIWASGRRGDSLSARASSEDAGAT